MSTLRGMGGGKTRFKTHSSIAIKNPFNEDVQRQKTIDPRGIAFGVGLLLVLIGVIYALYFSNWGIVQTIQVTNNTLIPSSEIENKVWDYLAKEKGMLPKNHFFSFSTHKLEDKLLSQFPLQEVSVDRKGFNSLAVAVHEVDGVATIEFEDGRIVLIDEEGKVLALHEIKKEETSTSSTPQGGAVSSVAECIFCDTSKEIEHIYYQGIQPKTIGIGTAVIKKDTLLPLISALRGFATIDFRPSRVIYVPLNEESITVELREGFSVYLNPKKSIEQQLTNFNSFMKKKFVKPPYNLQYVDLRYTNRIFYK